MGLEMLVVAESVRRCLWSKLFGAGGSDFDIADWLDHHVFYSCQHIGGRQFFFKLLWLIEKQ